MKRILLITCLIFSGFIFAQYNWQRVNYMQSMIFSSAIVLSDVTVKPGDVLGAFVGDECRMIATVFLHNDTCFVSSVIHGDVTDTVRFKLWLQDTDTILLLQNSVVLTPGGSLLYHKIIK